MRTNPILHARQTPSPLRRHHRSSPSTTTHTTTRTTTVVAQSGSAFNINKALDKQHETKYLKEIIDLPPSALQGLAPHVDDTLATLKITSIKALGTFKYFTAAKAIVQLASTEEQGARNPAAVSNVNKILKSEFEGASFTELLSAPVYAFQGLTKLKAQGVLEAALGVKTIQDLAECKYANWAAALTALSKFENEDHSSR